MWPRHSHSASRQLNSQVHRLEHTALIGLSGARDIECSPVIDRGPDYGKTDGDVHSGLQSKNLHRPVSLIVIHRDDQVEVSPLGAKKQAVGRQRSLDIPSLFAAGFNSRQDFLFLFAITEQSVFTCVRIDATDANFWALNPRFLKRTIASLDGSLDQARLDLRNGVNQADVGRYV